MFVLRFLIRNPKQLIVLTAMVMLVGYALSHAITPALAQPTGACLYQVQVGDELKLIAARYNVTTQQLWDTNRAVIGSNPDIIYPGQDLDVCFTRQYAAASQTVPNPVQAPATYSIRQDILNVFGQYGQQAIHIATCESGITTTAYNPIIVWVGGTEQHAMGVFQVIGSTWAETPYKYDSPYNAADNVRAAYYIFARDGNSWREWSTWRCALGY